MAGVAARSPVALMNRPVTQTGRTLIRSPAVFVAVAFALGILADRLCNTTSVIRLTTLAWPAATLVALCLWIVFFRWGRERQAAVALLAGCFFLGGTRHHIAWWITGSDNVATFAREKPEPVCLIGTVGSSPVVRGVRGEYNPLRMTGGEKTTCRLNSRWLDTGRALVPVSGSASLSVNGLTPQLQIGDEIRVHGNLVLPASPHNPGEFNYREYQHRCGIGCFVTADSPEAIDTLKTGSRFNPMRLAGAARRRYVRMFNELLSPRTAGVASAMLLGDRSGMNDEIREMFIESGTLHILAISGVHVCILAGFVWFVCRIFRLSVRRTAIAVVLVVVAYAFLTEAPPSVVRAALFVALSVLGRAFYHRHGARENMMAVAAIVVLAWNPTDLFDAGAQLSFLAVAAVFRAASAVQQVESNRSPLEQQLRAARKFLFLPPRLTELLRQVKQLHLISAAVWLVTTPLILAWFNIISPIGLLVNVLLIPISTLVLWLGYLFMLACTVAPWIAAPFATAFDLSLGGMLAILDRAARTPFSHYYAPAPSLWWLVGFYTILVGCVYWPAIQRFGRRRWAALAGWMVAGLVIGLVPTRVEGLRLTFISVGHGLSVLVEAPNGRTLLYDAGSLYSETSAQRRIQGVLWSRGHCRIESIVVSHADIDHFNAVPGLMESIPIGSLMVSPQLQESRQAGVVRMLQTAERQRVPVHSITAGDRLAVDKDVGIEVLHPSRDFRSQRDNASSLVLAVEYAGRRILLTGDLDSEGTDELLSLSPRSFDVLLSPHHGSPRANSPQLAAWARPKRVVVSTNWGERTAALRAVYGDEAAVLSTAECGATTIEIDPEGHVRQSAFLKPSGN